MTNQMLLKKNNKKLLNVQCSFAKLLREIYIMKLLRYKAVARLEYGLFNQENMHGQKIYINDLSDCICTLNNQVDSFNLDTQRNKVLKESRFNNYVKLSSRQFNNFRNLLFNFNFLLVSYKNKRFYKNNLKRNMYHIEKEAKNVDTIANKLIIRHHIKFKDGSLGIILNAYLKLINAFFRMIRYFNNHDSYDYFISLNIWVNKFFISLASHDTDLLNLQWGHFHPYDPSLHGIIKTFKVNIKTMIYEKRNYLSEVRKYSWRKLNLTDNGKNVKLVNC